MAGLSALGRFAYSLDEEYFYGGFDTREQALHEGALAAAELRKDAVYTGQYVPALPIILDSIRKSKHLQALLEELNEFGVIAGGEQQEDFCHIEDLTEAEKDDFKHLMAKQVEHWLYVHGRQPGFASIDRIETHHIASAPQPCS